MSPSVLLGSQLRVVNVGLDLFAESVRSQDVPVAEVDWRPPAGGDPDLVRRLVADAAKRQRIAAANEETMARMFRARPIWVDVRRVGDVIPNLAPRTLLHSGPAIPYARMCGPHRRAAAWVATFEGWADDPGSAAEALANGRIRLEPASAYSTVCPMAGVVGPSMAVHVVTDRTTGITAYSPINEGRERTTWNGNPDSSSLERLAWFRDELAGSLSAALRQAGGIDLFGLFAQSLQMGDELHARLPATTALLIRSLAGPMLEAGVSGPAAARAFRFLEANSLFGLTVVMAGCKVAADAGHGVPWSSVVTGISRNAVDFGLRVGGLGDRWVTAPIPPMDGVIYRSGYGVSDAAGDIGDSAILEVVGLGGMAIAGAPTVAAFVGGSVQDEIAATDELREIVVAAHPTFTLPVLGFAGTPSGIDVRRVVETGIVPFIDTGAIHERDPDVGQIGAGIAWAPMEVFRAALVAVSETWAE
jgi:Protein of unknown function (DUF1116).